MSLLEIILPKSTCLLKINLPFHLQLYQWILVKLLNYRFEQLLIKDPHHGSSFSRNQTSKAKPFAFY